MIENDSLDKWFEARNLTLDAAGLSEQERENGSIFLGGSSRKFIKPSEQFNYGQIDTVLFNWGDPKIPGLFAQMMEFDDRPAEYKNGLFPFSASTVVNDDLWMLAVQDGMFRPNQTTAGYHVVPYYEKAGAQSIDSFMDKPTPRREQLIGKVGLRWVMFEMSIKIR